MISFFILVGLRVKMVSFAGSSAICTAMINVRGLNMAFSFYVVDGKRFYIILSRKLKRNAGSFSVLQLSSSPFYQVFQFFNHIRIDLSGHGDHKLFRLVEVADDSIFGGAVAVQIGKIADAVC